MNTNTKRTVFCPSCSSRCIRWGTSTTKVKRYRCLSCRKTFRSYQKSVGKKRPFLWYFEQYVLYGSTYAALSRWSGYSIRYLEQRFHKLLGDQPPALVLPKVNQDTETYLILDGKWFGKKICLMLYRQSKSKLIVYASFMSKEYGSLILKNLRELEKQGYRFTGIISDGGTGIKKAVIKMYGQIPHQICMAHMYRQATNAIPKHPKEAHVQELRKLADHMWLVESKEARTWWASQVNEWIKTHGLYLGETRWDTTGHWWYIHSGARKSVRAIKTAYEECFTFLDHPMMPKTTNELEATIGNLSMKHLIHRGMKREKLQQFIAWYIYFYNRNLISQRKTTKD